MCVCACACCLLASTRLTPVASILLGRAGCCPCPCCWGFCLRACVDRALRFVERERGGNEPPSEPEMGGGGAPAATAAAISLCCCRRARRAAARAALERGTEEGGLAAAVLAEGRVTVCASPALASCCVSHVGVAPPSRAAPAVPCCAPGAVCAAGACACACEEAEEGAASLQKKGWGLEGACAGC